MADNSFNIQDTVGLDDVHVNMPTFRKKKEFLKNSSTQKSWLTIDKLPQNEDPGELVMNTKLERGLESGQSPAPADVGQLVIQPAAQPSEGDPMTTVRHSHRV